jgi:hypothetical protein
MLTDAVIKGLKPRGKQYKVADQGGLYLLVKPNGSRLWRLKYYIEGTEKSPLAFGVYPEVTLKRAREKQSEARKLLDQKIDPAAQRRLAKEVARRACIAAKVDTYSAIADEWFALYVEEMKHSGSPLSPETIHKIEWLLNLAAYRTRKSKAPHPLKSWLDRPIASFTKQDVAQVIGGLKRRGKIETAHRTLHCLVRLFKYAVGTERMSANPAQAFADSGDPRDKLPPVRERNHPALTNPRDVGALLRGIDAYIGYPPRRQHSSSRRFCSRAHGTSDGEMDRVRSRGQDVGVVRPSASNKNAGGAHHSTADASRHRAERAVFAHRSRRVRVPTNEGPVSPLVGECVDDGASPHGLSRRTLVARVSHDGEHTFARIGWDSELIERQLSHDVGSDVQRAYDKSTMFPVRRRMMQAWADYLDELRNGASQPTHSNVGLARSA